jgi:uncharacterized protein (TIGR02246 family)
MPARTPEDCDRLFGEGINAGDADAVAALYEESGGLVLETGEVATGSAIRGFLDAFVAMKPRLEMNVWRVVRCGDDLAVLYNDWRLTLPGSDGASVVSGGKAIEIVRRQADGTWKFALDDPRARG